MKTVQDIIDEEFEAYQENDGQDCLIRVYKDEQYLGSEYIEACPGVLSNYTDEIVKRVEYYTESVYVFV